MIVSITKTNYIVYYNVSTVHIPDNAHIIRLEFLKLKIKVLL